MVLPVILPSALRPGDAVALVSPSGPVAPHRVAAAIMVLTKWGLRAQVYPNVMERAGYLGGPDEQRLADLNAAFADPSMRAVWCTRGGYGLQRIVDRVDYAAVSADPSWSSGFPTSPRFISPYGSARVSSPCTGQWPPNWTRAPIPSRLRARSSRSCRVSR
jgi:hypothetical protein